MGLAGTVPKPEGDGGFSGQVTHGEFPGPCVAPFSRNTVHREYTLSKQASVGERSESLQGAAESSYRGTVLFVGMPGTGARARREGVTTRFFDHWFTRFNWNRVMSNDSRDSDVFLLGVGYRWAAH
jgi:hypothetical protein